MHTATLHCTGSDHGADGVQQSLLEWASSRVRWLVHFQRLSTDVLSAVGQANVLVLEALAVVKGNVAIWYTNRVPPFDSTRVAAVEVERTRQFMFFHARSSAHTVNGIASLVKRIRRFEGVM